MRALWGSVFKVLRFLPFASLPVVSGAALAALLCDDPVPARSGAYLDYRLREVTPSQRARDVSPGLIPATIFGEQRGKLQLVGGLKTRTNWSLLSHTDLQC